MSQPEKFRPHQDFVLLKNIPENEKTAGGIFLPKKLQDQILQGEIVKSGAGYTNEDGNFVENQLKAGDKIAYPMFAAQEIFLDQQSYILVRERNVLGSW